MQDEGVSKPMHPLQALGKVLFQAFLQASGSFLAHGGITVLCSPCVRVSVSKFPLYIEHIPVGPHLNQLLHNNPISK